MIVPAPADAPPIRHGAVEPDTTWDYRDAEGNLLHRVGRWNRPDGGKEFRPFVYGETADGLGSWRSMHLQAPRPLYGLDRLAQQADAPVLITEGEKTADAAARLVPGHVAVTSSGGARAASKANWSPLAGRDVIIWPDHDEPGARYAADVARLAFEAGASSVRIVEVPSSLPAGWDLADALPDGMTVDGICELVVAAKTARAEESTGGEAPSHTPTEPVPLVRQTPPAQSYPVDALPAELADVVGAIYAIVQSPPAMCASTVLAVVTLAAQAHVNVDLPVGDGLVRPVSSFFLTVGRSGERKSATDDLAMRAVKEHEAKLRLTWEREVKTHKDAHDAWEAERKTILGGGKGGKQVKVDRAGREADLRALGDEPPPPLLPMMTMADPTIEGLAKLLMAGQPSVGVFSAEGGQFVGGHAMSDDAKLRSAAAYSNLWDGEPFKRVRSQDGASIIANRRLAMHLLVQPDVAAQLINDPVLRDQGFMSRMLMTYPTTTMGTRLHRDPSPESLRTIERFAARMSAALSQSLPLQSGMRNELAPRSLRFAPEARALWIKFSDRVEAMLRPGGELEPISGFAAKMAEHAARLAAVLVWWSDHAAHEIDAATLSGAIRIVEHHGHEALRLWQSSVIPRDIVEAQRLLEWLHDRWDGALVSIVDISQLGPNSLRTARRAREMATILAEHGWLVQLQGGATIRGHRRRQAWLICGKPQP